MVVPLSFPRVFRRNLQCYWPLAFSILLATLTPLSPSTYFSMPR